MLDLSQLDIGQFAKNALEKDKEGLSDLEELRMG